MSGSEAVDTGSDRDTSLPDLHFDGIALRALDVQFEKFGGDLDADELGAAGSLHLYADHLVRTGVAKELLIDGALDDIFVIPQRVPVLHEVGDIEIRGSREGLGLFAHEGFSTEESDGDEDGDSDEEAGADS